MNSLQEQFKISIIFHLNYIKLIIYNICFLWTINYKTIKDHPHECKINKLHNYYYFLYKNVS